MSEHPQTRPVSGDILPSGAPVRREGPAVSGDIIDAEYVSVGAPSAPHSRKSQTGLSVLAHSGDDSDQRGGPVFWSAGLILVLAAFWISGGHALIGRFSAGQDLSAQGELQVSGLQTREENSGPRTVLQIDGQILNPASVPLPMPGLVINVEAKSGEIIRYALGVGQDSLAAGERYDFSSRLQAPAGGTQRVFITFENTGAAN